MVKRKTSASRFARAVRNIWEWCRENRHLPVAEQHRTLGQKFRVHCGYYGITGNSHALGRFNYALVKAWWYWLNRRSQRRSLTWEVYLAMLGRTPLPLPRAVHSTLGLAANP